MTNVLFSAQPEKPADYGWLLKVVGEQLRPSGVACAANYYWACSASGAPAVVPLVVKERFLGWEKATVNARRFAASCRATADRVGATLDATDFLAADRVG